MGFGKLSSRISNAQNEFVKARAQVQQSSTDGAAQANALAEQQAAMASARAASAASAKSQIADAVGVNSQQSNVALGVLDYIRTTSQGLMNSKPSTGKLTILGN